MTSNKPSSRQRIILPVLVAVGALVLAIVMATGGNDDSGQTVVSGPKTTSLTAGGSVEAESADIVPTDDPTSLGDANAPVVMVVYSEFQCPFCGKFAKQTLPVLIERYVDTGAVRLEWRDLPYLGEESFQAARAARAAAEQDAFWAYHDVLFADQVPKPNSGHVTDDYLVGIAAELGLDVDQFEADYEAGVGEDDIRLDLDAGMRAGVSGTPAFFVNGTPIFGAQPLEVFVQTIEAAAAAS